MAVVQRVREELGRASSEGSVLRSFDRATLKARDDANVAEGNQQQDSDTGVRVTYAG